MNLPTSGTTGPPKLVVHTLHTLMGAIADAPLQQWATFYDIRRYGGLQIFLRALAGRGSLRLTGAVEGVGGALSRFGAARITHISGTPSHWRNVLMSGEGRRIDPDYIRLSGEIADDAVLEALRALYPRARIEHAYASTEAGVVFAVDDGRSGFPASWLERDEPVQMRIADGALCVRSDRRALRFLGATSLPITDGDGFVDTGDQVEERDGRLYFVGRRGGVINVGGAKVHPEEVEAVLNAHAAVRASRAYARKNPGYGGGRLCRGRAPRRARGACGVRAGDPRRVPRATAPPYGSGRVAVCRQPADHGWRKALPPWIMSSSPERAEVSVSRLPNASRATVSASSRSRAATARRSARPRSGLRRLVRER